MRPLIRTALAAAIFVLAAAGAAEARCRDRELDALQIARTHALDLVAERPADAKVIALDTAAHVRSCARSETDATEAAKLERTAVDVDVVLIQALRELHEPTATIFRRDIAVLERIQRDRRIDGVVREDAGAYAARLRAALAASPKPDA